MALRLKSFKYIHAIHYISSPVAQNQIFRPHFPTVFFKDILEKFSFNPFNNIQQYLFIFYI
jgi:hypothetical protein